MESEAPSWADQWGAGGIGAMEDDDALSKKDTSDKKNKGDGKTGFVQKLKSGASNGFKWVKNKCQRKNSPK